MVYQIQASVDKDVKPGSIVIYNPSRKMWVLAVGTRGVKRIKNKFYGIYIGDNAAGNASIISTSGSVVVKADGSNL